MTLPQQVLISQDLSCVGQVSLGVALPIVAALGLQPAVLPTALLSTHTGGFGDNTYLDLSQEMERIIGHWQTLDLRFAGLYFGYLGQAALPVIEHHLQQLAAPAAKIMLDPVMGDHGQLYRGFDQAYVGKMRHLVRRATVVTPNVTEARLLLDQAQDQQPLTAVAAAELAQAVSEQLAVPNVILTGVPLVDGQLGVFGFTQQKAWRWQTVQLPGHYFGTGDIFASVCFGLWLQGQTLQTASQHAMIFVQQAIQRTTAAATDIRFGVDYAAGLHELLATLV
ncbi:pyridoxamine kinase [Loigolactobacillus zhaoyuanensis]|uniref:pyridoxal kinase n=1 Tax=Loigolactobacillus zhaoyuanensis TaxID=2486017 RepID=A0ABW8UEC9_9LACO|nr:pyridoxamine kinase [Loigolactobacillus zhaoyuanensis]